MAGSCLPEAGNMLFLRSRNTLIRKLGLTPEEIKEYKFVVIEETGQAKWGDEFADLEFEIELSEAEHGMLSDGLARMEREQKLTPNHMTLYEKFIEG